MSREQAIIHYRAAMAVFGKWLAMGYITPEEHTQIDTIIARKYGISSVSIYRSNA